MSITFRSVIAEDLGLITVLLHDVFRPTYGAVLSEEQIKFMLSTLFSQLRMERQLAEEGHQFIMMFDHDELKGFAAYECNYDGKLNTCKLHKLYLANGMQGKGLGRLLLREVIRLAKERKQEHLMLNVNRGNRAKNFYRDLGFRILEEVDIPLGNGYFMNDYVLDKAI